jgi:hypothetical protein
VAARPVLGWGQEGFRRGFAQEVSGTWVARYGLRELPDRAHNRALDLAASEGIAGLAADGLLLVAIVRVLVRRGRFGWPVIGVVAAGLAWLVQGLFLFDVFDAALLMAVLAGAACAPDLDDDPPAEAPSARAWWLAPTAGVAVLGIGVAAIAVLGVVSDHQVADANGRPVGPAVAGLADAARTRPRSLELELLAGSLAVRSGDAGALRDAHDLLQAWDDPDVRLRDADVLAALAEAEGDRELAIQAADTYLAGLADWPANGPGWLGYGRVLLRLHEDTAAERALLRAQLFLPRDAAPWIELGLLAFSRGDTTTGCGYLASAAGRRGAPSEPELEQLVRQAGGDPACLDALR